MDLISIIIPVYNVEKYLIRCLDSVIYQTYENLEIIVIDDGSTDGCAEILDIYANKDSRLKIVHKQNGGVSAARNVGLNMVTGDYVGFLDSDDWIDLDYYEVLHNKIVQYECDIVISGYISEDINGRKVKIPNVNDYFEFNSEQAIKEMLKGKLFKGHLWNKLYKASLFKQIRFQEDIHMYEDLLINTEILLNIEKAIYYPIYKYHYFRYPESAYKKSVNLKYFTGIDASERINQIIEKNCSKVTDIAQASALKVNLLSIFKILDSNYLGSDKTKQIQSNINRILNNKKSNKYMSRKHKLISYAIVNHYSIFKYIYIIFGKPYLKIKKTIKT